MIDHATRYLIERIHKSLNTGLNAEALPLETEHRLFAAVALMSIVALRLLDLPELRKAVSEAPAKSAGLSEVELELLSLAVNSSLPPVASVLLAVGRPGGRMNRTSDGMPGWITLWRALKKLHLWIRGAELERNRIETHVQF